MFCLTDSRGNKSKTLAFVTVTWLVVVIKFLCAGLTLPMLGQVPVMTGGEFAAAVGAVLGIWLGREWKDKGATNAQ